MKLPDDDPAVLFRGYAPPANMITRDATAIQIDELRARLQRQGKSAAEIEAAVAVKFAPKGSRARRERAE